MASAIPFGLASVAAHNSQLIIIFERTTPLSRENKDNRVLVVDPTELRVNHQKPPS
jgi:hypothetical protein